MFSYLFCRVECITDASGSMWHRCVAFQPAFQPLCPWMRWFLFVLNFYLVLCVVKVSLSLSRVCGCLPVSCGRCSFSKAEANGESGKGAQRLGSRPALGAVVLFTVGFVAQDTVHLVHDGGGQLWKNLRKEDSEIHLKTMANKATDPSMTRSRSHLYCSYILHELVRVGGSEEHRTYTLVSQAPRCRRAVKMFIINNIIHNMLHILYFKKSRRCIHARTHEQAFKQNLSIIKRFILEINIYQSCQSLKILLHLKIFTH